MANSTYILENIFGTLLKCELFPENKISLQEQSYQVKDVLRKILS